MKPIFENSLRKKEVFPRLASSSVAGILSERRHLLHYSLETGGGGGGDLVVKEEEEEDVVTTGWFGWSGEEEGRGGSHLRSLSLSLFRRRRVCIRSSCLHCRERKVAESPLGERRGGGNEIQAAAEEEEDASLSLWGRNNTEPD